MDTLIVSQLPSTGSSVDVTTRVISNKFGDGYRQTVKDGLNAVTHSYKLTWSSISVANATLLDAFFTAHVGLPFLYQLPREATPRKWDCESWSRTYPSTGWDSFTATLTERFDAS